MLHNSYAAMIKAFFDIEQCCRWSDCIVELSDQHIYRFTKNENHILIDMVALILY